MMPFEIDADALIYTPLSACLGTDTVLPLAGTPMR